MIRIVIIILFFCFNLHTQTNTKQVAYAQNSSGINNPGPNSCDWPQFHGPGRRNRSPDTGLLKKWPEAGPKLLWKNSNIGRGFSSVAISKGMIYTAGNIDKKTVITAMDMTGEILWQKKNGDAWMRPHPGARGTPTIDDNKLYHFSGHGDIICLDAKTGKKIWGLNVIEKFQGRNIRWGLSESLLVEGKKLFCSVGGINISYVALDKDTGKTIWTCPGVKDMPGYCSPALVDYKGLRQIITLMSSSVVGIEVETGRLLWQYPHEVSYDENINTPYFQDGFIYITASHEKGSTLLKLNVKGKNCSVEEVWQTKELDNQHGGVILEQGYLYGKGGNNHHWACLEFKTGKTMYSVKGLEDRSATLTYADGLIYMLTEKGVVAIMRPNPKKFSLISSFPLPKQSKGKGWAYPVVCGGKLYVRWEETLFVYDVHRL